LKQSLSYHTYVNTGDAESNLYHMIKLILNVYKKASLP